MDSGTGNGWDSGTGNGNGEDTNSGSGNGSGVDTDNSNNIESGQNPDESIETDTSAISFPSIMFANTYFAVITNFSSLGDLTVEWSLKRNSNNVVLSDYIEGALTNTGGTIRFKEKGTYTLTASVTDATSRVFEYSATATVYPVPEIEFALPDTLYTDDDHSLTTVLTEMDGLTIVWTLERDGSAVTLTDYIEGTLNNDGGIIRFMQPGSYTLIATTTDGSSREFTASDSVTVYPVSEISFVLPATLHTDSTHNLVVELTDLDGATVQWSLTRDGSNVEIDDYIVGTLNNSGGDIRFKQTGTYVLTATVTDSNNRGYSTSASVVVYPVPDVIINMPTTLHTDTEHELTTTLTDMDDLSITWSIKRNGVSGALTDWLEGTLDNNGGTIRFTQPGNYTLTASFTDATDREFTASADVTVHSVAEIAFSLPAMTHTDITHNLATILNNMDGMNIVWKLEYEGLEVSLDEYLEGTLNNDGGSIRFKVDGVYTLTATATDGAGRDFATSLTLTVYPVIEFDFTLPDTIHTDDTFEVAVTIK